MIIYCGSEIVMPVSQIEQAKIAELFEELDHLTLSPAKVRTDKNIEKYMLQKNYFTRRSKVPESHD